MVGVAGDVGTLILITVALGPAPVPTPSTVIRSNCATSEKLTDPDAVSVCILISKPLRNSATVAVPTPPKKVTPTFAATDTAVNRAGMEEIVSLKFTIVMADLFAFLVGAAFFLGAGFPFLALAMVDRLR